MPDTKISDRELEEVTEAGDNFIAKYPNEEVRGLLTRSSPVTKENRIKQETAKAHTFKLSRQRISKNHPPDS